MYFPIGWPRILQISDTGQTELKRVVYNRDKVLFALLSSDSLSVHFCKVIVFYPRKPSLSETISNLISISPVNYSIVSVPFQPCVPIAIYKRSSESVAKLGFNKLIEWRSDSSMLVVMVSTFK